MIPRRTDILQRLTDKYPEYNRLLLLNQVDGWYWVETPEGMELLYVTDEDMDEVKPYIRSERNKT